MKFFDKKSSLIKCIKKIIIKISGYILSFKTLPMQFHWGVFLENIPNQYYKKHTKSISPIPIDN